MHKTKKINIQFDFKNYKLEIYHVKMADPTISGTIVPNNNNSLPSIPPTTCNKVDVPVPNIMRRLLPVASFLITFATVMTILLIYMDTTAMQHHQFQMNMTQDYDLMGVSQDNPQLITYIREVHIRPAIEINPAPIPHDFFHQITSENYSQPTQKEELVARLLNYKKNGVFIETGAYRHGRFSDTEWLERNLSWTGLLVQTYPHDFFDLLKHNRPNSKAIHACLSNQPHPKEISIPQEGRDGIKINGPHSNSLFSEDQDWFNTRVKCFPLYSLMLAMNATSLDFLNIDSDCTEFHILETLPYDLIRVKVISIHIKKCNSIHDSQPSPKGLKQFLSSRNYKFIQKFLDDYVFVSNHIDK